MLADGKKIEKVLQSTLTVGELRELLAGLDGEIPVVTTSDYGDYGHTQQVHTFNGGGIFSGEFFSTSAYSVSGVAFDGEGEQEPTSEEDEEARKVKAFVLS